jgi:hypothetical protein
VRKKAPPVYEVEGRARLFGDRRDIALSPIPGSQLSVTARLYASMTMDAPKVLEVTRLGLIYLADPTEAHQGSRRARERMSNHGN